MSISIPESVCAIGDHALFNCTSLTNVYYTGSKEERDMLINAGWIYEGIGWYGLLK